MAAKLTIVCDPNQTTKPIANNLPNLSVAFSAILNDL